MVVGGMEEKKTKTKTKGGLRMENEKILDVRPMCLSFLTWPMLLQLFVNGSQMQIKKWG